MNGQLTSASRPVVASGDAGTVCQKTGPYVYNNGYLDIIVFVKRGDAFPANPAPSAAPQGGRTQSQTTRWSMVSATEAEPSAI